MPGVIVRTVGPGKDYTTLNACFTGERRFLPDMFAVAVSSTALYSKGQAVTWPTGGGILRGNDVAGQLRIQLTSGVLPGVGDVITRTSNGATTTITGIVYTDGEIARFVPYPFIDTTVLDTGDAVWKTSATCYIEVAADPTAAYNGFFSDTRYLSRTGSQFSNLRFRNGVQFMRWRGIQIQSTGTNSSQVWGTWYTGVHNNGWWEHTWDNCIFTTTNNIAPTSYALNIHQPDNGKLTVRGNVFEGFRTPIQFNVVLGTGSEVYVYNNTVRHTVDGNWNNFWITASNGATPDVLTKYIYNNVIVLPTRNYGLDSGSTPYLTGNFGGTNLINDNNLVNFTSTYASSGTNQPWSATDIIGADLRFVNAVEGDLRLLGSAWVGTGKPLDTDPKAPFTTAVNGTFDPLAWNRGAYAGAAPVQPTYRSQVWPLGAQSLAQAVGQLYPRW